MNSEQSNMFLDKNAAIGWWRKTPVFKVKIVVVSSSVMNEGLKCYMPTHHSERHFTFSLADNVDIISGILSRKKYTPKSTAVQRDL